MTDEHESEDVIKMIDYLLDVDAEEPEARKLLVALRERVVEHELAHQADRSA